MTVIKQYDSGTSRWVPIVTGATGPNPGRNMIINGSMEIDQRNIGGYITPNASGYTLDRWYFQCSQASKMTVGQNYNSLTPPPGMSHYYGIKTTSAYSIGSGDYFDIYQAIEGFNSARLSWGTSSASDVTLSFWVNSSLTGTFGGSLRNGSANRSYPFTYTISAANTWEKKTITIPGDTSGTWWTDTGVGVNITFSLGVGSTYSTTAGSWASGNYANATGSTSVVGTLNATFNITAVQFEMGSSATEFEYRQYGTELALCQRYFEKSYNINVAPSTGTETGMCFFWNTTQFDGFSGGYVPFKVTKRTNSYTVTTYYNTGSSGAWQYLNASGGSGATGTYVLLPSHTGVNIYVQSGLANNAYRIWGQWTISDEL